jgi:D-aspartate ligase
MLPRRRHSTDLSNPAVVMGLTAPGIAIARSLGRAGIETIAISSAEDPPAAHSRLFGFRQGPSVDDAEEALAFYLELGRELGRPAVLCPTGDPAVLFISTHRDELEPYFRFLLPRPDQLRDITSKRRFAQVAAELALPFPRTLIPRDLSELKAGALDLRYPCLIKPEFTQLWRTPAARAAGLRHTKAIEAANADELVELYEQVAPIDSDLIVQEKVPGPDESHVAYLALIDPSGRYRAEAAGRKFRMHPAHLGMGTYVEALPLDDVGPVGRLVLDRLEYRGMAELEFKLDERDGQFYLYEINPRFNVWIGLTIASGVDFPLYYYLSAVGKDYEGPTKYVSGKRWLDFSADREALREYLDDGSWTRVSWLASVARARSWSLFAADDPLPTWVSFRRWIRHDLLAS